MAFDRTCMHEFVLSGRGAKEKLGVKTLDLAKRMLDHGVHPPTVYFPLLVDEALMIEPTETETRERLDGFADVVRAILEEAAEDPDGRPLRAVHHSGAPAGRGGGGEAAGRAAARARGDKPGRRTCREIPPWADDAAGHRRRRGASARLSCGSRPATTACRSRRSATTSRRRACTTC